MENKATKKGMGEKRMQVTLENSILTAYYKAKDTKKYTQILYLQLVNLFSQHELAVIYLLCGYTRIEQTSEYIIDHESRKGGSLG